jgi:hypothetical protein
MVTHRIINSSLSREIKKFLWKGWNSNHKRFHLVNWNIIWALKIRDGLGIIDTTLMNVAMGVRYPIEAYIRQKHMVKKFHPL